MSGGLEASGGTVFHHSSSYSGDVRIITTTEPELLDYSAINGPKAWAVSIPFADLRELVMEYMRSRTIQQLEQAEGDELEELLTGYPVS
jgi:hypothetical protein